MEDRSFYFSKRYDTVWQNIKRIYITSWCTLFTHRETKMPKKKRVKFWHNLREERKMLERERITNFSSGLAVIWEN